MRAIAAATTALVLTSVISAPAGAFTAKAGPLAAAAPMEVAGTLTCQVAPGLGLGVASSRPGTCIFDHIGAEGFSEGYDSRLIRVGLDIGVMGSQSFKLTVLTPGGAATPGMLAGSHEGRSSETSFVKAEGLKVSFRSSERRLAFEQSGDSSWVGFNIGNGETSLQLENPHDI